MSSYLTALGLSARPSTLGLPTPVMTLVPHFIIANFITGYLLLSSRFARRACGLGGNTQPRDDIAKYGDKMVQSGKIKQEDLDR